MWLKRYWKYFGLFVLCAGVVIALVSSHLSSDLRSLLLGQLKEELRKDLNHTAQSIQGPFLQSPEDLVFLDRLARENGREMGERVSIISAEGRMLGDSARSPKQPGLSDDYSHRPEIIMAREKGYGEIIRHSPFMNTTALFAAVPVHRGETLIGFVRLARPLKTVEEPVRAFRQKVILLASLVGLLSLLFGAFLLWWMNHPLKELTAMAEQMALGHLKQPLHLFPLSEFTPLAHSLEKMSRDLRGKLDLLDAETSRLRAILLAMREGVLVTNEKGLITLINPFLRDILGGKIQWEKRTVQELFMNAELQNAVDAVLQGESFQRLQLSLGWESPRFFEVQIVPLISVHLPQGAVVIFHDITDLKHLLKVRQDFVANASHELRTPLTAISGALETILTLLPATDQDAVKFLTILEKNVRRMNYLVSDLLDLAKLEGQERAEMFLDEVNVREVLQSALHSVSDFAQEKNISLELDLSGISVGCSLFWERDRVQQAIFNLLDNAVKYTPPGGDVRLSAREADKSLVISVTDSGLGIPKEHLSRIFERFYRVDRDRSRELGGTGLGLSIVKHIVEAHRGTVEAQSELGRGSSFTITFPKK
jgi:two-component system, OmpR family, phosphate regulon sensor histidine kinase PhoR